MPNIKSAKKRVLVSAVKELRNKSIRSRYKTEIKKFREACDTGNKANATALYASVISMIDRAVSKGIIHKNTASHKKSQLTLLLNKLL